MHANIERACTGTEIGTPGEYVQVFKSAKNDDHLPDICEDVECSFFVDWKQVSRTALRPGCTDGISHMHWIRAEKVNGSVVLSWSESAMGPLQQVDWRRVGGQFGWGMQPTLYHERMTISKKRYEDSISLIPLMGNKSNARAWFSEVLAAGLVVGLPTVPQPTVPQPPPGGAVEGRVAVERAEHDDLCDCAVCMCI